MMRYIFISKEADPFSIADRLKDEGKQVVVGLLDEEDGGLSKDKDEARRSLYKGILDVQPAEKVLKWMAGLENKDEWFVMFDYGDLWEVSERALEMGFTKGIFPTEVGYQLEQDREAGKAFAKKNYPHLTVAPAHEFKKVDEAIKFLDEQDDKIFVLKSEGSYAETVVPTTEDADLAKRQIIGALKSEKSDYEKGFTLEEKIKDAIEFSPVMLFWDGKPLFSLVELENKPLGAGNIGRLTGGCQNLSIQTPLGCKLNRIAFPPAVFKMAKQKPGITIFDAGILASKEGKLYFTEFCSERWGWDGIFSEIEMSGDRQHTNAASRHFDLISEGKSPITWRYGAAVRMFQTEPDGKKVDCFQAGYGMDWDEKVSDHLWFYCMEKKEDQFCSVGYRKDLAVATGSGDTIQQAVDMAYRAVDGFAMTGALYRPKFDMMSRDYKASILNRLDWLKRNGMLT